MKKEKGITLVSLVVTIIILIILAGVSLNLVLGENGIITMSKQAKEKTEQAKLNEEIALNELYMQIEAEGGEASSGDNSNVYIEKLAEFKKAIADYIEEAGGVKPEYTADSMTFRDSIKGIVKEVTKLSEEEAATADNISEGKKAWVNGQIITGIMKNSDEYISLGVYQNANVIKNVLTIDVTKYTDKYQELSSSNFIVVTDTAVAQAKGGNGTVLFWSATKNYNSTNGTLQITTSDTQTGGLWIGANSGLLYVFLKM